MKYSLTTSLEPGDVMSKTSEVLKIEKQQKAMKARIRRRRSAAKIRRKAEKLFNKPPLKKAQNEI